MDDKDKILTSDEYAFLFQYIDQLETVFRNAPIIMNLKSKVALHIMDNQKKDSTPVKQWEFKENKK